MTNSDRLRLLINTLDMKPPPAISDLDSLGRMAREKVLEGEERPESLAKYFDPLILEVQLY